MWKNTAAKMRLRLLGICGGSVGGCFLHRFLETHTQKWGTAIVRTVEVVGGWASDAQPMIGAVLFRLSGTVAPSTAVKPRPHAPEAEHSGHISAQAQGSVYEIHSRWLITFSLRHHLCTTVRSWT